VPHTPILVLGAGGHGRVVAEVAQACGHVVEGFVDDGLPTGTLVLGRPVVGTTAWLLQQGPRSIALGLGDNRRREQLQAQLEAAGHAVGTFIHPTAWISPTAELGAGTVAMARVVVNAEARVGRGVILNTGCIVEHECVVGHFAHLSPAATLGGRARIGERTHVGLGASVIHLGEVGVDCVVGAGAAVIKGRIADGLTVVGVPARPLRR
jgi:sugar O-acyltransferase (sialic acid O-acetyltransferase NeuD family)